ncbi:MAG: hypothetical protein ACKV2O_12820 [Acidimicrobiales bacterium]
MRAARQRRQQQPYPSLGRRLRSVVELVVLVGVLGVAVAGTITAAMVGARLAASHLLGG